MPINVGEVFIDVLPNTTKFGQALTAQVSAASKTSEAAAVKTGSAWSRVSQTVAQNGALIAAAGVAATVKFATSSVQAAVSAEQAQLKLANAVQNSSAVTADSIPIFQAQAQALRDITGVDDDVINAQQGMLVSMGLTADQITQLTPLLVDLAAKGFDLSTATKAVGKSVNGTTGGLARMGVIVDKTKAATDPFAATLEALGVNAGLAAKQADAEPWRLLGAQFEQLQEDVGHALLPAIQDLSKSAADLFSKVSPAVVASFQSLGDAMNSLVEPVTALAGALDKLGSVIPGIGENAGLLGKAFKFLSDTALLPVTALGRLLSAITGLFDHTVTATVQNHELSKSEIEILQSAGLLLPEVTNLTEGFQEQADAARELRDANAALAGGLLEIVSAVQTLADDQKELNALRRKGQTDTRAYRDGELKLLQDADQLNAVIRDQSAAWKAHGLSLQDAIKKVVSIGEEWGLSAKEARDVLAPAIQTLKDKYDILPSQKKTEVIAVDHASAILAAIKRRVDELARTFHINIVTDVSGGGQHGGQQEHGGYIPGAATGGFVNRDQVIRIGEKSKAEMILPLQDAAGIAALTKALERAGAGKGGNGRMHIISGRVDLDTGQLRMIAREEQDDDRDFQHAIGRMA